MNQTETLARLNKEKEYEDKLVYDLSNYFLDALDSIEELSQQEKAVIMKNLGVILSDSKMHSHMFNVLIESVIENEEDDY